MQDQITQSHHEASPSKLDRIAACPWSLKNCRGWTSENSPEAARGTLLHAAVFDDGTFDRLSEREREMIDFIRAEHVNEYAKRQEDFQLFHERKVQVMYEGSILTEGTLDFLVITKDGSTASLKDWKFGSREVPPAEENYQIIAYVCGIFQQFPAVHTVYAMIVQPAYGAADYERQASFTRDQLPDLLQRIRRIIQRAQVAEPCDAVPSASSCRYCNKLACQAFRAKMDRNFQLFAIDPEQLSDPGEKEMTVDFADRLLCAKREIEAIMEDKAANAKKLILANGGSASFRVQAGRVTRRTYWKRIVQAHDIPQEEIDAATVTTECEPYLVPRMRRKAAPKLTA